MKLLNLPTELIVFIFERVPVTDLVLHLPLTCNRCINLSQIACTRRTSLTLIFGNTNILGRPIAAEHVSSMKSSFVTPQSSTDTLRYKEICALRREFLSKLMAKFPNVCSIQLAADGIFASQLKQTVTDTLGLLSKLEALHLILYFEKGTSQFSRNDRRTTPEALKHTISVINRMPKLRKLIFATWEKVGSIDLPILGQLREFYFHSLDDTEKICETMVRYGVPNRELKRIGPITRTATDSLFSKNILLSSHFASTITHLAFCDFSESLIREEALLMQIPSLKALIIYWNVTRPLESIIRLVAKLKLDYLRICIEDANRNEPHNVDLSSLILSNCRIDSVKVFSLKYYDAPLHESLLQFNIDKIFPNVKLIYMYTMFTHCATCQYTTRNYLTDYEDYVEKRTQCIKYVLQSLQQISSKPKIELNYFSHSRNRWFIVTKL